MMHTEFYSWKREYTQNFTRLRPAVLNVMILDVCAKLLTIEQPERSDLRLGLDVNRHPV